jgi:hypothetical protein
VSDQRRENMHPIADGILAGLGAGSVFIVAQMIISAALTKPFLDPLRIISTMLLGRQALDPSYSFATAVVVGLIFNIVLSGLFGLIFVFILMVTNVPRASGPVIAWGFFYGIALWLVNFCIIAPGVFPQFSQFNQFWNGFVAHSVFYGAVLGLFTALSHSRTAEIEELQMTKQRRYGYH